MISDDPAFTDPAMAVIRRYDPQAYEKITADDGWNVSTGYVPGGTGSDAVTHIGYDGMPLPRDKRDTILGKDALREDAAGLGVPVTDYTASVLVHEFQHHDDGLDTEVTAYRASVRFDRRLPPGDQGGMLGSDLEELRRQLES